MNCTIKSEFSDNIFPEATCCHIKESCQNNKIGNLFLNNNIGRGFSSNKILFGFIINEIGDSYSSNLVGNYFTKNIVDVGFEGNTIANSCTCNKFGANANGMTIGADGFQNNELVPNVCIIGDGSTIALDFTSANMVYNRCHCLITSTNGTSAPKAVYFNANGTMSCVPYYS